MNINDSQQLRVAILGASGIGKNHAAWFAKNGAQIVSFLGGSQESNLTTSEILNSRLGYTPQGFTKLEELISETKPNAVCIASPPELHYDQAQSCLENKVHVLCEKPLVYDAEITPDELLEQADQLYKLASEQNVLLGTQMQYSFIARQLCDLAGVSSECVEDYTMEMETKNMKPGRLHETIWIELAPHPLSVLQKIVGEGELDISSINCEINSHETTASFVASRKGGKQISAKIIARYRPDASTPLRRFTINDSVINYAGRKNQNGDFLTYLSTINQESEMPDLVDILIGNFVGACHGREDLQVTGRDGLRNVKWMLQILERGKRI